jgi:tetratricopeptide (TPR) repeat protein
LLVGGCVTRGPLLESRTRIVELDQTPFFPQEAHECGPAALATVLGASSVSVTPEALESRVYLPGRRGSLQVEMQAAPRAYGRLAYRIEPELSAITAELDAHRPVLVLHNYGLPFWPRWHYAVVVGYDGTKDVVILRSGRKPRQKLSAANFMRAWDNGDRWALVVLRPGELPEHPDKQRYLEAAAAFEGVAQPKDAWLIFDAAVKQWPDEPVTWIGRGTANYRLADKAAAAADYRAALGIDHSQPAARNNLAMALLEMGCATQARQQIEQIDVDKLDARLRSEVMDTRRQIDAGSDSARCPAP